MRREDVSLVVGVAPLASAAVVRVMPAECGEVVLAGGSLSRSAERDGALRSATCVVVVVDGFV